MAARSMLHFSMGTHIHCPELLEQESQEDAHTQLGRVYEPQDVASSHLLLRPLRQYLHRLLRLVTPRTHRTVQLCNVPEVPAPAVTGESSNLLSTC